MPQFFVAPEDVQKKSFRLTGPEAFHVVKVLRYSNGQSLALFDGKGGRFEGVIETLNADGTVTGRLTATLKADDARKPVRLHLHLGLLKASHWDYALEKGTELGVASFVPVLTPRLSSYWLHLVTPVKAGVARPLIEGLRTETIARDGRLRELVPFEPTGFDEAARTALAAG